MKQRTAQHKAVLTAKVIELRMTLGKAIVQWIRDQALSNIEVGKRIRLSGTDVSVLLESEGQQFNVERLVRILTAIGGTCELAVQVPGRTRRNTSSTTPAQL